MPDWSWHPPASDGTLRIPPALAQVCGLYVDVEITSHLSDVLEVPEDRQNLESWTGRLLGVLRLAQIAFAPHQRPTRFRVDLIDANGLMVVNWLTVALTPEGVLRIQFPDDHV